jgi:hypothetical protein
LKVVGMSLCVFSDSRFIEDGDADLVAYGKPHIKS